MGNLQLVPGVAGVYRLPLSGKIYAGNVGELEAEFKDAMGKGAKHILLECSGLLQVDSTALSAIIAGLKTLRTGGGGQIIFIGLNDHIRRILSLIKLDKFCPVVDDEAAALAVVQAAGRKT